MGNAQLRRKLNKFTPDQTLPFEVKLIHNIHEFKESCKLVHKRYYESGYINHHSSGLHLFLRDFLPTTYIFIAKYEHKIIGTTTAYHFEPTLLPAYQIYPDHIKELTNSHMIIVESSRFACDKIEGAKFQGLGGMSLIGTVLTRLMFDFCISLGNASWLVVVNPKVRDLYINELGFEEICGVKSCPHVNGNPGVLLLLDTNKVIKGLSSISPLAEQLFLKEESSITNVITTNIQATNIKTTNIKTININNPFIFDDTEIEPFLQSNPDIIISATEYEKKVFCERFPRLSFYF